MKETLIPPEFMKTIDNIRTTDLTELNRKLSITAEFIEICRKLVRQEQSRRNHDNIVFLAEQYFFYFLY